MAPKMLARATLGILSILIVIAASRPAAHHGWSGYESDKPLTLTGVVKTSGYENPHASAELEVAGTLWRVVLAPPSRMQARGVTRDMLKPGTTMTVVGYPHKTEKSEMRAERLTIGEKTAELR